MRGKASLAQAAFAAAAVRQQEPLGDSEPPSTTFTDPRDEEDSEPRAVAQQQEQLRNRPELPSRQEMDVDGGGESLGAWEGEGWRLPAGGSEAGDKTATLGGNVGREAKDGEGRVGTSARLSLPPAAAAASSRVRPGGDRREELHREGESPGGGGDPSEVIGSVDERPSGPGAVETASRVVAVQDALWQGLDRMVTRLQYDTGLQLETRYKNFDAEYEQ